MKAIHFIIAALFWLLANSTASAQPYGFLTWSVAEGLPQSQVTALAQDNRGYLWVGTNGGGVARFDGNNFTAYGVADGLVDNFVKALAFDPAGNLHVLSRRGLATMYADSSSFQPQTILYEQDLLLNLNERAVEWSESYWNEHRNALIYTTETMVATLEPGSDGWTVPLGDNVLTSEGPSLPLPNGKRLQAVQNDGLYLLTDTGEPLAHYTEAAGDLPHDNILCLLRDRQNRVWAGTSGGGLVRMIPSGLRYFDEGNGLAGERVYAVHAGTEGKLWVGASARGMQFWEGERFQRPPVEDPTIGTKIGSITQDLSGRTYFATDGKGVALLDSNRVQLITSRSGLNSDYVLKVLPTGPDDILAATYAKGLNEIKYYPQRDSFAIRSYGTDEGIELLSLASIIPYREGYLLGGTDGRIQDWAPTILPAPATSPQTIIYGPDNGLPPARISSMLLRRGTQLWVAALGYGLYYTDLRAQKPRFFPLPSRLRDLSTNIFQLVADPNDLAIWVGTERGVSKLYLNRDGQPDYLQHYGRAEGFLGGETTRDAVTIDSLGRIWFGTLDGLVRYEDDRTDLYLPPPPAFLESTQLFYAPVAATDYELRGGRPTFSAQQNHFQFRYGAVDLTYPDRLRFRYKLTGEQPDWSPLTSERAVRFAGLGAGRYTFTVEATTDGGKTFGEPASYSFAITAPLIRQGWFLGLLTLALAGLIIGLSYYFYRRVQRREAALRAELETQNQLLNLEQKARQLQMNPHFIFNALNGIRGLIDGKNDAEARRQITSFATLMRGILNNSRQEMITLEEEIDVLRRYIEMERFCQRFPIDYTINVAENIDPEEVSLPPMLLQPFVENAILHGLAGREDGGTITVSFALRGRRMQCTVEDDGIGRKAAAERAKGRAGGGHKSVAVAVTGERLRAGGGSLEVLDLAGGGTRVVVLVGVEVW